MILKKPKFWKKKDLNILPYILWPLSILLQSLSRINKLITKKKIIKILKRFVWVIYILEELAKRP